jgi:hypothetical protein
MERATAGSHGSSTIPASPKGVNGLSRNHEQHPDLFLGSGMQRKSFKEETRSKKGNEQ